MSYIVATYRQQISKALAVKIDQSIRAIDPTASFIRHYDAGNDVHGWIERPNDGTNDYVFRRAANARLIARTNELLVAGAGA